MYNFFMFSPDRMQLFEQLPTLEEKWAAVLLKLMASLNITTTRGTEHATEILEHLENGSVYAVMVPHRITVDPFLATKVVKRKFVNRTSNRLGWIGSVRFVDAGHFPSIPDMGLGSQASAGWIKKEKISWFSVVQPHYYYGLLKEEQELADELNRTSTLQAREFLRDLGNILLVSPEGTRNRKKGIQRGYPGAGTAVLRLKPSPLIVPIIPNFRQIFPRSDNYFLESLVFGSITIGKPISVEEIKRIAESNRWSEEAKANGLFRGGLINSEKFNFVDAMMLHAIQEGSIDDTGRGVYSCVESV